jgi:hypothetical protein
MSQESDVRMSVRILDETGAEIVSFFSGEPSGDDAFRKKYPKTRFIDDEFQKSH